MNIEDMKLRACEKRYLKELGCKTSIDVLKLTLADYRSHLAIGTTSIRNIMFEALRIHRDDLIANAAVAEKAARYDKLIENARNA